MKGVLLSVVLHGLLIGGLLGFSPERRRPGPRRPPVKVTLVSSKVKAPEPRPAPPASRNVVSTRPKRRRGPVVRKARPRARMAARRAARAAEPLPARRRAPVTAAPASTPGQQRRFTVALSATVTAGGVLVPTSPGGTGDPTLAPGRSTKRRVKAGAEQPPLEVAPATTVMPTLLSQPSQRQMRAAYPPKARKEGIEGDVRMKILVSASGEVTKVRLLRRAGNGFDEAARQLVRRFRFKAARRDGRAVAVWIPWTYKFRLSG